MKYLLFLMLWSCSEPDPIQCNYDLTDTGKTIRVVIYSDAPSVEYCFWTGEDWMCHGIAAKYYDCVTVSRFGYPMRIKVDGCEKEI